jgi:hypothetical protein
MRISSRTKHQAKLLLKFRTVRCRYHFVYWDEIPIVFLQGVEHLTILLARIFEDLLGCDETVGHKGFYSSLFIVDMTCEILVQMEGWLRFLQYRRALSHVVVALRWFQHPLSKCRSSA